MPRGGARTRSGPPRDPNALRRDRDKDGDWLNLPAEGRDGPVPDWPLSKPTKREQVLWGEQWSRPQAVAWEMLGQELEVALFVRATRIAEQPSASAADRNVVLRHMDGLGLTVGGLAKNRWRIIAEEAKPARRKTTSTSSARDRLKVVQGGSA